MIAVVHWHLYTKTHHAGEVVIAVISFCLPFGCHCWLDRSRVEHGRHVTCVNWNKLQDLAWAISNLQLVATRLPGVQFPLVTLLVGEKLFLVNNLININKVYLGLACKGSDYTAGNAIKHWPECKKLVLKLTLVVEIWALLSRHWQPLLKCSLRLPVEVPFLGKAHRPHGRDRCRSLTLTCWNSPRAS